MTRDIFIATNDKKKITKFMKKFIFFLMNKKLFYTLSFLPLFNSYKFPFNNFIKYNKYNQLRMSSSSSTSSLGYVDVHCHLFHEKLIDRVPEIIEKSREKGMDYIILNGLEPESNRVVLDLCDKYNDILIPALGIYPLDAACNFIYDEKRLNQLKLENNLTNLPQINWNHEFSPPNIFNVDEEINFIEEKLKEKKILAIGECGLDKHYLTDEISFQEQERVLRKLMKVKINSYYISMFIYVVLFYIYIYMICIKM